MSELNLINTELMKRLRDVTQFMETNGIDYALAGGLAVAVWGEPRTTYDIDFVVASSTQQVAQLKACLDSSKLFVFEPEEVRLSNLMVVRAHLLADDGRDVIMVDFLCVAPTLASSVLDRRILLPLAGDELFVISPEDLVLLKLQSARAKDLEDVRGILREQSDDLDRDYLRSWIGLLNLSSEAESVGLWVE